MPDSALQYLRDLKAKGLPRSRKDNRKDPCGGPLVLLCLDRSRNIDESRNSESSSESEDESMNHEVVTAAPVLTVRRTSAKSIALDPGMLHRYRPGAGPPAVVVQASAGSTARSASVEGARPQRQNGVVRCNSVGQMRMGSMRVPIATSSASSPPRGGAVRRSSSCLGFQAPRAEVVTVESARQKQRAPSPTRSGTSVVSPVKSVVQRIPSTGSLSARAVQVLTTSPGSPGTSVQVPPNTPRLSRSFSNGSLEGSATPAFGWGWDWFTPRGSRPSAGAVAVATSRGSNSDETPAPVASGKTPVPSVVTATPVASWAPPPMTARGAPPRSGTPARSQSVTRMGSFAASPPTATAMAAHQVLSPGSPRISARGVSVQPPSATVVRSVSASKFSVPAGALSPPKAVPAFAFPLRADFKAESSYQAAGVPQLKAPNMGGAPSISAHAVRLGGA
eukprot:TRINITY_DN108866_c0_g1_i1.p1 TRINITY_DN108866_c0_g1~~TRINITY_DN108866_c0_g1_i1.p1  ORF type:complete len:449 (+),score=73.17 TRINITY_DN108866_c0_g1_i1:67-1413(+)